MDARLAQTVRRFLLRAPDGLTDEELLELLLDYASDEGEAQMVAAALIERLGSVSAVLDTPAEDLAAIPGMDERRVLLLRLVTELHRRYYLSRAARDTHLSDTASIGGFLLPYFYGVREEVVYLLSLDATGRVLTCRLLGHGSVNSANVPMRRLMQEALTANATGVVLAHNHPSGIALPSREDVELTLRLREALDVVGILLIDHLVVADDDFVSMKDSGYFR